MEKFPDIWELEKQGKITYGERRLLEWQYRLSGDFYKALWEAISRADETNLMKLYAGFPDEVHAFQMYSEVSGYWDELQERIGWKDGPRTTPPSASRSGGRAG
jgi:hypothetical protein